MTNCLDSSFLVDFLDPETEHHEVAVEWMRDHREQAHAVPAICAFEVIRGRSRAGVDRFDRTVGFLRTLELIELSLEGAIAAGRLNDQLQTAGTPLSARDTLVATPALERGDTLISRDRDFERVPKLDVVYYDET